jgi:hypothetical protein
MFGGSIPDMSTNSVEDFELQLNIAGVSKRKGFRIIDTYGEGIGKWIDFTHSKSA